MRQRQKAVSSLPVLKFAGVALLVSLTSACSADVLRFSDSPFANPFNGRVDTATTGAIQAPTQRLRSSSFGAAPAYSQTLPRHVGTTGQVVTSTTQVAAASSLAVGGAASGWSATGGTPIRVGAGETIEGLSGRYGVPVSALRSINGLSGGAQPSAGQQLIIPAYNPGAAKTAAAAAATTTTASTTAARIKRADPIGREAAKASRSEDDEPVQRPRASAPSPAKSAKATKQAKAPVAANDEDDDEPAVKPKVAPKKKPKDKTAANVPVPKERPHAEARNTTAKTAAAQPKVKTAPKAAPKAAADEDDEEEPASRKTAAKSSTPTRQEVAKHEAKTVPERVETAKSEKSEPETTGSVDQEFRWPARGRVISGYGAKGPSGANDGINIALPEGTPVKATEGGTVAYAGEEIKGYGKMVLIRHPNGFVSAYAHNGDLNVKRGDVVKRGQQIAKSGQSGNVTSPQLHFELRKGSAPVDPSKFLEGN